MAASAEAAKASKTGEENPSLWQENFGIEYMRGIPSHIFYGEIFFPLHTPATWPSRQIHSRKVHSRVARLRPTFWLKDQQEVPCVTESMMKIVGRRKYAEGIPLICVSSTGFSQVLGSTWDAYVGILQKTRY